MSRRNKDRKDSRSDRDLRKSDDRKVRDKRSRRHDEKKRKHRHRSKSPAKSRRARSSSSSKSPEREKKSQLKPVENHVKPLLVASTSSSPQKSPMISLTSVQQVPPEPKIELPAYYNPNVINVTKFAEQQKKRKLIWSSKKEEPAKDAAKWGGAKFSQDSDGTKASKFMRLMGIKDGALKAEAFVKLTLTYYFSQLLSLNLLQLQSPPMSFSRQWNNSTKSLVKSLIFRVVLALASDPDHSRSRSSKKKYSNKFGVLTNELANKKPLQLFI